MSDEIKEVHPSFGMVQFSRVSSSTGQAIFGSSVTHHNTIRLTVGTGSRRRGLNHDHYMMENHIIELEMSPTQFAEMITSMNIGTGIPCSIIWKAGEGRVERGTFVSKREEFENEFAEHVKEIAAISQKLIKEMATILAQPTIKKADRERLTAIGAELNREVAANTPFIASMFNEQMDKTVQEAKGEVEAFFHTIVNQVGVDHLSEKLLQYLPEVQTKKALTDASQE